MGILLGNLALLGGPALTGLQESETFAVLAELGAILLLFEVGLESTPREMLAVGGRATAVALVGVACPWRLGLRGGRVVHPQDPGWSTRSWARCSPPPASASPPAC